MVRALKSLTLVGVTLAIATAPTISAIDPRISCAVGKPLGRPLQVLLIPIRVIHSRRMIVTKRFALLHPSADVASTYRDANVKLCPLRLTGQASTRTPSARPSKRDDE